MKKTKPFLLLTLLAIALMTGSLQAMGEQLLPPKNPFMADTYYYMLHGNSFNTAASTVDGPKGKSRRLKTNEVTWKPLGPGEGWTLIYSGPYPDGRQVIWAGGTNKLVKLDADSLETLASYSLREGPFYADEQTDQFLDDLDIVKAKAEKDDKAVQAMAEHFASVMTPIIKGTGAFYRFVSNTNEHYQMTNDVRNRTSYLKVYGDQTPGDASSPIELKRSWQLPQPEAGYSAGIALNSTFDGWIIIATADGWVYALSRDFNTYYRVQIPGAEKISSQNWMDAFIRNGIAIDDDGGIYVVTKEHLHRIQWTGSKLSTAPEDGAWVVPYPSGKRGSGTTPTLLGWGEGNDKLIVIADGLEETSFLAYWRDAIPGDWTGISGEPKRLAGKARVNFGQGIPTSFPVPTEASVSAMGYGFFAYNDYPTNPPTNLGSSDGNIFANILLNGIDRYSLQGGAKYIWDTKSRSLRQTWTTPEHLGPSICSPSTNGLLYCFGRKQGEWAMKSLNWETGALGTVYLLGNSNRFNPGGAVVRVAPNGAIDCPCGIGWGMIRLNPQIKYH